MKLKFNLKKRIFDIQFSKADVVVLDYFYNDRSTDILSMLDTMSNLFYYTSNEEEYCLL